MSIKISTLISLAVGFLCLFLSYVLSVAGADWASGLFVSLGTSVFTIYLTVLLIDVTRRHEAQKSSALRLAKSVLAIEYGVAPFLKGLLYEAHPDVASRWALRAMDKGQDEAESLEYAFSITEEAKKLVDTDLGAIIDSASTDSLAGLLTLAGLSAESITKERNANSFDQHSSEFLEDLANLEGLAISVRERFGILIDAREKVKNGRLRKEKAFTSASVSKVVERFLKDYYQFRGHWLTLLEKRVEGTSKFRH